MGGGDLPILGSLSPSLTQEAAGNQRPKGVGSTHGPHDLREDSCASVRETRLRDWMA